MLLCRHAHKAAVTSVRWNRNGNWLLTASRDHLIKLYDIRTMTELEVLKGHKSDVNSESLAIYFSHTHNTHTHTSLVRACTHTLLVFYTHIGLFSFFSHSPAVSWHPVHEKLFTSGGSDGAILFWLVGSVS